MITTRESLHEDLEQPEISKLIKKQNKTALRDFPGGPVVKNPPLNVRDTGSVPTPGRFHMA